MAEEVVLWALGGVIVMCVVLMVARQQAVGEAEGAGLWSTLRLCVEQRSQGVGGSIPKLQSARSILE